jgi:diacylglycerol kinase family enzyme
MPLVAFVINKTRVGDPGRFGRRCRAAARAAGWEPLFAETSAADGGYGAARQALADGASLVFAAGGDGTVRACAQALAGTPVPLAIIPLGTANLTARALGIPGQASRALHAGFHGRDRLIDMAVAELGSAGMGGAAGAGPEDGGAGPEDGGAGPEDGGAGGVDPDGDLGGAGDAGGGRAGLSFAAMAGIGLDAAVVGAARVPHKHQLGWVAYAMSGLASLSVPPGDFTIRLDGGAPLRRRARCVVVGNAGLLPGGFVLLPGARLDDGWLDVGILAPTGLLGWPRAAAHVLSRSHRQDRTLERFQARRVEISAGGDLPRQIDGEVIAPGRTLTVSVRPGALTIRQPK